MVAIKEVSVDAVDPSKLPGILREAEVLSRLSDPNIVKIFDVLKGSISSSCQLKSGQLSSCHFKSCHPQLILVT